MLPVADGSDFMGSLRNPAGWNNVFGLRPSQGRVPMAPTPDVWISQLGTEGPMARTVQDLAQLLEVQAGYDPRAPLSIADHACFTGVLAGFDCKKARIGWLADLAGYLPMEPGILAQCEQGLTRLQHAWLRQSNPQHWGRRRKRSGRPGLFGVARWWRPALRRSWSTPAIVR